MYKISLHAPIASKLERILTSVRGSEWAEKTTVELLAARKNFGLLQASLEAWL
jgi:hypothetical protein